MSLRVDLPRTMRVWSSTTSDKLCQPDTFSGAKTTHELYNQYEDKVGPFTSAALYNKKIKTVVSNIITESTHMLNSAFNDLSKKPILDLYPSDVQHQPQQLNNETIYPKVKNGVYECDFAKSQQVYGKAVRELFDSLDLLEEKLRKQQFLGGDVFTCHKIK
eukprot:353908-Ditylum_brightwellii.AAC.1